MTTFDYRQELQLRDDALRRELGMRDGALKRELDVRDEALKRELDMRHETFLGEQALRDKAWDERFNGFLRAQAERDRAFETTSQARFARIENDIASIKSDAKAVSEDIHGLKLTLAKYFGGAIVVGAISSAALSAGLRAILT